jgi:signal transduction histidine kinase
MRTPLGNIIMLLDLMKTNTNDRDKLIKYLNKLDNPAQYLLGLSNDIVNMKKIEMGNVEIVNEDINIRKVILDSFAMIEEKLKEKNIKFSKNIEKLKHTNLIGDKLRLKQIFINILVNAINHTSEGGKITFSAKEIKRTQDVEHGISKVNVEFKISDNGEGMNTEFLEHIWEAYSKDNTSCFKNVGTGLGMAITKQYINLMNGNIEVKSEIGVGSIFIINLTFQESINTKLDTKKIKKIA